jgi:hypothetical protein
VLERGVGYGEHTAAENRVGLVNPVSPKRHEAFIKTRSVGLKPFMD